MTTFRDLPAGVLAELVKHLDKKYPAPAPTAANLATEEGRLKLADAAGARRVIDDIAGAIKVKKREEGA